MLTRTVWYTLGVEDGWEKQGQSHRPTPKLFSKMLNWLDLCFSWEPPLWWWQNRWGQVWRLHRTVKGSAGSTQTPGGWGHSCLYTAAGGAGWSPEVQRCFLTGCFTRKLFALHGCWPRPNPFLDEMDICKLTGHSLRAVHLRQAKTKA